MSSCAGIRYSTVGNDSDHRQDRTFLPPADFCRCAPTNPAETRLRFRGTYEFAVFEKQVPLAEASPPEPGSRRGPDVRGAAGRRRVRSGRLLAQARRPL